MKSRIESGPPSAAGGDVDDCPLDPGRSLMEFADLEPNPENILLGNRCLCRQGGLLFVGPSGIGKSSASVQQDLLWAAGLPAFGISPKRPLKILCIQAEDDEDDLREIVRDVRSHLVFSEKQLALATMNCTYVQHKSRNGLDFVQKVVSRQLAHYRPDLLRINPFQAYLGGDIKDPATTSTFLRNGVNPLLERFNCGLVLVHHTPKTTFRDTEEWKASDWMYAGAGSADITNWARAALIIDPTNDPAIFRFIAAKRGRRIGWADGNGSTTIFRHFKHSVNGSIAWGDCDECEVPKHPPGQGRGNSGQWQKKYSEENILDEMSTGVLKRRSEILALVHEHTGMSERKFDALWAGLRDKGIICQQEKNQWLKT